MSIGEDHAILGEGVEVGRLDFPLGIKALHVAITKVVAEDVDNIWLFGGRNDRSEAHH